MYAPAPERPRKTNITRSREGCKSCRSKRRKCDEGKPRCRRCVNSGDICAYDSPTFDFRDARSWAEKKVKKVRGERLVIQRYESSIIFDDELQSPLPSFSIDGDATPWSTPVASQAERLWIDVRDMPDWLVLQSSRTAHTAALSMLRTPGPQLHPRDHFYLHHFATTVLPMLPPQLRIIQYLSRANELALSAAKALSAAHLAVFRGGFIADNASSVDLFWAPGREQKMDAFRYTASALKLMISSDPRQLAVLTTTHLILSLVEMTLGTIIGLRRYINSIDDLIARSRCELEQSSSGKELLQAVADSRASTKLVAGPWNEAREPDGIDSVLDAQELCSSTVIKTIGSHAFVIGEQYMVLSVARDNLKHPHPLLRNIVAKLWFALAPQALAYRMDEVTESELDVACEQALETLASLSRKLSGLPAPYLGPAEVISRIFDTEGPSFDTEGPAAVPVTPITFNSHEEAMDAVRYAQAVILCDETLLKLRAAGDPQSALHHHKSHRWLEFITSVAYGMNMSQTAGRDLWSRSVATMLVHSTIRCHSRRGFSVVEKYVDIMDEAGVNWADIGFSTKIIRPHFATLRRLAEQGRKTILSAPSSMELSVENTTLTARLGIGWYIYGIESDGRRFVEELQPYKHHHD